MFHLISILVICAMTAVLFVLLGEPERAGFFASIFILVLGLIVVDTWWRVN